VQTPTKKAAPKKQQKQQQQPKGKKQQQKKPPAQKHRPVAASDYGSDPEYEPSEDELEEVSMPTGLGALAACRHDT
jgi:hypothetical protein